MCWLRKIALLSLYMAFAAGIGTAIFVYLGLYNVSALRQHTVALYDFLTYARIRSVSVRAEANKPVLDTPDWRGEGVRLYEQHCVQCHGAPGSAPHAFSLGMMPAPSSIIKIGQARTPEEIYWVIENGVKMSGMPAWSYRLSEEQMWAITALTVKLHTLTVQDYRTLRDGLSDQPPSGVAADQIAANPKAPGLPSDKEQQAEYLQQGKIALQQYNCSSCHVIPGVTAAANHVGPPLTNLANQSFIAGVLENTSSNLAAWIRFPQKIDPDSAMPNLGVSALHADQMVEYLKSVSNKD